jgi:protein tyrosine phosphatase (PTP) superfamily phosphohydrolase (DUF442 family)
VFRSINFVQAKPTNRCWQVLPALLLLCAISGCQSQVETAKTETSKPPVRVNLPDSNQRETNPHQVTNAQQSSDHFKLEKLDRPGLHNLFRLSDWLYSGSSPESPAGFQSLRDLGVKSIISVDGARPDVEVAKRLGLRYVHVPVGYDGISNETAWQLAKAAGELPHPVYVHCHHGKHRGPTAAAQILRCNDSQCTATQALSVLQTLGTDPKYVGLYNSVKSLQRPTVAQLDAIKGDFPEIAQVPRLAELMVQIDAQWDELKLRQASGWKQHTAVNSDGVANPAVLLTEHYQEALRLPELSSRPKEFLALLQEAHQKAEELERLTSRQGSEAPSRLELDAVFNKSAKMCSQCHAQFRDVHAIKNFRIH